MKSTLFCVFVLLTTMAISTAVKTAAAQTPVVQTSATLSDVLEQAAYQQDTANNPGRAIELYRQVIDSEKATRQMVAQALYNTGLCYAKLKHSSEADQAFGAVVSQYKGLEPYYRLANARLNPSLSPTTPRWQDGERLEYESRVKNVDDVVDFSWTTTTKVDWNGRTAWKMINRVLGNNGLSMIIANEKSLRPIYSLAHNPDIGRATATWTDNSVEVSRTDQQQTKTTRFEGVVYDAEQQGWLLRHAPMSVGTKIKSQLLSTILSEKTFPLGMEVVGEEQIQVPAGQFNAYKLTDDSGISTVWIDKGPERHLIKLTSAGVTSELKRISKITPNAWRTVTSSTSGFGITIPDEWFDANKPSENKYPVSKTVGGKIERSLATVPREEIHILGDDTNIQLAVVISDLKSLQGYDNIDLSLAARVAWTTDQQQRFLPQFAMREGSRVERVVANLPAISNVADYQERNEDWVMYSTYVIRDTKMLSLVCFTQKGNFSEAKPTFDRMLSTITF